MTEESNLYLQKENWKKKNNNNNSWQVWTITSTKCGTRRRQNIQGNEIGIWMNTHLLKCRNQIQYHGDNITMHSREIKLWKVRISEKSHIVTMFQSTCPRENYLDHNSFLLSSRAIDEAVNWNTQQPYIVEDHRPTMKVLDTFFWRRRWPFKHSCTNNAAAIVFEWLYVRRGGPGCYGSNCSLSSADKITKI